MYASMTGVSPTFKAFMQVVYFSNLKDFMQRETCVFFNDRCFSNHRGNVSCDPISIHEDPKI